MRSAVRRREALSEEFVPYRQHVEHWALALDDGSVLGGFRVPGRAWETADPEDVDGWHNRLNQMVRSLASAQLVLSVCGSAWNFDPVTGVIGVQNWL
jgi:type IV secretion system protein VirB4